MSLAILILLCSALLGQEPIPPAYYDPETGRARSEPRAANAAKLRPPTIPADHAAEYFAAAAAFARIDAVYKQAQAALEAAKSKVIADCGPNATPNEGSGGKMVCDVKPEAPKAAPSKPATAK